jgi:hypothetical protein
MKMARSRTRKKPKIDMPPEVATYLDEFTNYIGAWTKQQVSQFHQQLQPICIKIKNGYKVGLYTLKVNADKTCSVYNPNDEFINTFDNTVSAILYATYMIQMKFHSADKLLALDKEINKNYIDVLALKRTIRLAVHKKDYETVDIRSARLEIAQHQLSVARESVSKIYRHAKYNKIWDN